VFEASSRLGGRCHSDRETFASGQIVERGGELIDTEHRNIRQLARRLGLTLDDVREAEQEGTDDRVLFDGARYSTAEAVRDFRPVYPVVIKQARAIGDPTYHRATPLARELDALSVTQWVDRHVPGGAGSRLGRYIRGALEENYATEADDLSALIVVAMLATSTRTELDVYGGSDQRFHVRAGNDAIAIRLAAPLRKPVSFDSPLLALTRRKDGRCEVVVGRGASSFTEVFDRVILALPFANLREVDITDAGFRERKLRAIRELPMGAASKLQLHFDQRFWLELGSTGYVMLDAVRSTWDATRAQQGTPGILTVWTSGRRAEAVARGSDEDQARLALAEVEQVLPGVSRAWNGRVRRTVWDAASGPKGAYASYPPGYMTSLFGIEWESEGPVHFAGEHTSRAAQGFLEGAVESGRRAAREVLSASRRT
jgi:monoamine oxidase